MNTILRSAFENEMNQARQHVARGGLERGFAHIERAHILGQTLVVPHARAHWLMFKVEVLRRRPVAALGQLARIVLGALGSAIGVVPVGNTGGSDVGMFERMPIEPDLMAIIEGHAAIDPHING